MYSLVSPVIETLASTICAHIAENGQIRSRLLLSPPSVAVIPKTLRLARQFSNFFTPSEAIDITEKQAGSMLECPRSHGKPAPSAIACSTRARSSRHRVSSRSPGACANTEACCPVAPARRLRRPHQLESRPAARWAAASRRCTATASASPRNPSRPAQYVLLEPAARRSRGAEDPQTLRAYRVSDA